MTHKILEINKLIIKKYKYYLINGMFALSIFLIFFPILKMGYYNDDFLNADIRGACINADVSLFKFARLIEENWRHEGRLFPLAVYINYALFYVLESRFLYKLILIILNIACIYIAGKMVEELTQQKDMKYYTIWLLGLLLPLSGGTPVDTWGGLYQFMMIFGMSAILQWNIYCKKGKIYNLICSLILLECSMLIFEVGYLFPMVIICIWIFDSRRRWKAIFPIALLFIGQLFIYGYNRYTAASVYVGTRISFSWENFVASFRIQLLGAFPMSWILKGDLEIWRQMITDALSRLDFQIVITWGLSLTLGIVLMVRQTQIIRDNIVGNICLILCGAILWVGSSFLISITEKYSAHISNSRHPYLPMFVEHFGAGMCLVGILGLCVPRLKKIILAIIFIVFCIIILPVQQDYVRQLTKSQNDYYVASRNEYIKAIKAGMIDEIEKDAVILIDLESCLWGVEFFAHYCGYKVEGGNLGVIDINIEKPAYISKVIYGNNLVPVLCKIGEILDDKDEKRYYIDKIYAYSQNEEGLEMLLETVNIIDDIDNKYREINIQDRIEKIKDSIYCINLKDCLIDYQKIY